MELQQVIHEGNGLRQVPEHPAHGALRGVGHEEAVHVRDRPDGVAVGELVEAEHGAVPGLERVPVVVGLGRVERVEQRVFRARPAGAAGVAGSAASAGGSSAPASRATPSSAASAVARSLHPMPESVTDPTSCRNQVTVSWRPSSNSISARQPSSRSAFALETGPPAKCRPARDGIGSRFRIPTRLRMRSATSSTETLREPSKIGDLIHSDRTERAHVSRSEVAHADTSCGHWFGRRPLTRRGSPSSATR